MKRYFFIFFQTILVAATLLMTVWTIEEATKRVPHDWVPLLYVWSAVLWILSILSLVFKKKILQLKGYVMTIVILCGLFFVGSVVDTYYVADILSKDIVFSSKLNQSILCISLWTISVLLFLYSRKLIRKNKKE